MNALPRPAPVPAAAPDDTPLLRTLLLTDLCDSTEIMEKRGDAAAAQIYRDLDRVVLELQQRWRGRLIDRSDGLLLLFERPIDGLGFALDYMKALKDVGARHDVELRARAGLHVGEVLTWRNSVEAVQLGAKPLEVEGLTKPMAARLMTLARPGQILVSAIAEPLAHRAARELGERGDHLLWKSHGYWCFKGVPGRQEVYEVGEAGLAPLRAPRNGPKAWRDIPLWRRPASLAAEVLLLAGLGIGGWYATRPEPAIAFAERDWVVMGDLRNLTGDPRLDESLEQAFRISLEQSRYVNVLSDLKARETLQRMQKPEGTAIDRATASEIAVRDGVRAVILPTVSEVGGRLRVSAEVVDPRTQSTVYALSADGKGIGSVLDSVDEVTGELRGKLGEALAAIDKDSKPLPQVTTSNIDALKAYALGESTFGRGEYANAEGYYRRAIDLDKAFALAYVGIVKSLNARGRISESASYLEEGIRRAASMTARDRAYLMAWQARMFTPRSELDAWSSMAELYPDDSRAVMNSGYLSSSHGLYPQAISYMQRSVAIKNSGRQHALVGLGDALMASGNFKAAARSYREAQAGAPSPLSSAVRVRDALLQAAAGQPAQALASVANQRFDKDVLSAPLLVGLGVAAGEWDYADHIARDYRKAQADNERLDLANGVIEESLRWLRSHANAMTPGFRKALQTSLGQVPNGGVNRSSNDLALIHLYAAILALRMGDMNAADEILKTYQGRKDILDDPEIEGVWRVVLARNHLRRGDTRSAISLLERKAQETPPIQTRVALIEAYRAAGNTDALLREAKALRGTIGQAFIEIGCGWCQQSLNIADETTVLLDIATVEAELGNASASRKAIADFDRQWPRATLPAYLRMRRDAVPTFN